MAPFPWLLFVLADQQLLKLLTVKQKTSFVQINWGHD